jgi:ABC-type multidrug transport system ATPase subunit
MIDVSHVTKRYGEKVAVDDLTFAVKPGIVTGFLGPNGAGKSTTMRMILGLDAPTSGHVLVNENAYRDLTAAAKPSPRCAGCWASSARARIRASWHHSPDSTRSTR